MNVREDAAQRWIQSHLVRVDEQPGGPDVLEQPSFAALYASYCAAVPAELRWEGWRLVQSLPRWAKRYTRKASAGAKWTTVHYAGVRIK